MKFGKRQLVLASLVLALGAAVYLNWIFSSGSLKATQTISTSSQYGDTQLVVNDTVSASDLNLTDGDIAQTESQISVDAAETFSQARLTRQQSRDAAIELLQQVAADIDSDAQAKQQAVEQAAQIAQNIVQETNIENLVKAKGYADCMVYLENEQCTLVISGDFNEQSDAVILQDLVMTQTGLSANNIKIVPIK